MRVVVVVLFFMLSLKASDLVKKVEGLTRYSPVSKLEAVGYDPFYAGLKVIKNSTKVTRAMINNSNTIYLSAVLNNKAFINGRWCSVGDRVLGYRIVHIDKDVVKVKSGKKVLKISLKKRVKFLKIKEKEL